MAKAVRFVSVFGFWLVLAAAFLVGAAVFGQSVTHAGTLGPGDAKLGKYFDSYPLQLTVGERLLATLRSEAFDAYLILEAPDGTELENDDYGESNDARFDVLIDQAGEWRLKVTSYEEGEEGEYLLVINRERLRLHDTYHGALEEGDPASIKGELYDRYFLQVEANERILVSLRSDEFDTFLAVKTPAGTVEVNDDYASEDESRIDVVAPQAGAYEIYATSFMTRETGAYTLQIYLGGRAAVREVTGILADGDQVVEEYGYFEEHPLYLAAGEHILVEMTSEEVDTILIVEGPEGFREINDDFNDLTYISRLDLFAAVEGEYRILAGSYDPGGTGAYTLKIYSFGSAGSRTSTQAPPPGRLEAVTLPS
jgi:hypothetical protein